MVNRRLGETPIDALVLNAETILPDADRRTEDSLRQHLRQPSCALSLLRLLLPRLSNGSGRG